MKTLNELILVMPECNIAIVRANVEKWRLVPEAINALVEVFLALPEDRNITVDMVLGAWEKYYLHYWTDDVRRAIDIEDRFGQVLSVYRFLGIPEPSWSSLP